MAKKQQGITWTNERRKLADLIPWERNPRTIKNAQAERLVDSVETFGQVETLAIDSAGMIVNGHQRYSVLAGQYGMDYEVDVRVASRELTERERQQLTVYLHRGATGEWEPSLLFENFNLDDLTTWGFDTDELDEMFADFKIETEVGAGGDTAPQTDKTGAEKINERYQVKKGDVWKLGRHTIACVDSCDRDQVRKIIGDVKVGFVWADPPYGIKAVSDGKVFNNKTLAAKSLVDNPNYAAIIGDETIKTAVESSGLYLSLYPKAAHVWWGGNYYASALPNSSCWIIWDKETGEGFFADAELAWTNQDTAVRIFKHQWKGLIKDSERGDKRLHPTQKPVALAVWSFEKYGKASDIIVDPFLGSGISVLAAEELSDGRCVFGFELAPEYIAVTIHRWEAATGLTAHRLPQPELVG